MNTALTTRLNRTFGEIQAYADARHGQTDSPYHHLLRDLRDTARRNASFVEFLLDLAGAEIRGADVLDCGCGMGDNVVIYAAMDARSVVGVDIDLARLSMLREAIEATDTGGVVALRHEDSREMSFADSAFDIVTSIEVISHVIERERMYGEVYRVLRPGGVYLVSDFNNIRNPRIRRSMNAEWLELEQRGGRIWQARKKYIAGLQPDLTEAETELLADNTSLLQADGLAAAVANYRETGRIANPSPYKPGACPLNPDMVFLPHENLIDPFEEARLLQHAGFAVETYGYVIGGRLESFRWLNRLFNFLPGALRYRVARALQFVCTKPKR